jgi:hypothetical protein
VGAFGAGVGGFVGGMGVAYFAFVGAWGGCAFLPFSFAAGADGLSGSEWFRGSCREKTSVNDVE